jgi:hypothetical protein
MSDMSGNPISFSAENNLNNERIVKLEKALKIAVEALKDAEYIFEGSIADENQTDSELEKREMAIMRFLESFDKIRKLMGEL